MADESMFYEVSSEDDGRSVEIGGESKKNLGNGGGFDASAMLRKLDDLEKERAVLERENGELVERLSGLNSQLEELCNEKAEMGKRLSEMGRKLEESESDRKAVEEINKRAVVMESQVSGLQHELASSLTHGKKLSTEIGKLTGLLAEKAMQLEYSGKDKASLRVELEKTKAELESVAVQLRNVGNERLRVEEDAKATCGKKESEICELKIRIVELELVVSRNSMELEKVTKEMNDAVEAAGKEHQNVGLLQMKLSRLAEELDESKRVIQDLMDRAVPSVDGFTTAARGKTVGSDVKGLTSVKMQWPAAVVVSAGASVAVACVVYLRYAKRG